MATTPNQPETIDERISAAVSRSALQHLGHVHGWSA